MSDATLSDTHVRDEAEERSLDRDLQVWKHFAGMGGTDKNTMITTVSWLLAFGATAIGYMVTNSQMIAPTIPRVQQPGRMMVVSLLGIFVSVIAWYLAILYGGYSNRNWAKADEIARKRKWLDLLPDASPDNMTPERVCKPDRLAAFAWRRARPCYPQTELLPSSRSFRFSRFFQALHTVSVHMGHVTWFLEYFALRLFGKREVFTLRSLRRGLRLYFKNETRPTSFESDKRLARSGPQPELNMVLNVGVMIQ